MIWLDAGGLLIVIVNVVAFPEATDAVDNTGVMQGGLHACAGRTVSGADDGGIPTTIPVGAEGLQPLVGS